MTAIATPRAGQREWLGLAVLALACLLYAMDLTVLHLAVPSLSEDLRPSSVQLLWITDIYGFMVAGFLITMGTLGDRIGRRRLLLLGATAFGGVSVLAAFSTSPEMLIACRALLGIAGATPAPAGWTWPARPCCWSRCWRWCLVSRRSPRTGSAGFPSRHSWPGWRWVWSSCGASLAWRTR